MIKLFSTKTIQRQTSAPEAYFKFQIEKAQITDQICELTDDERSDIQSIKKHTK